MAARRELNVCDDENAVHFGPVYRTGRVSAAALLLRLLCSLCLLRHLLRPLRLLHLVLLLHLGSAAHHKPTG